MAPIYRLLQADHYSIQERAARWYSFEYIAMHQGSHQLLTLAGSNALPIGSTRTTRRALQQS
jgi:hypothetical protein